MVSISHKISCSLARISSFFENYFPLIPIIFSTSRKIARIKTKFSLYRKSISTSRKMDLLKNTFPVFFLYIYIQILYKRFHYSEKLLPLSKTLKNGVYYQEYDLYLKIDFPWISIIVFTSRKKLGIKKILFLVDKNSFPLAWMKDLLKNIFQLKSNLFPLAAVDCCLRKRKFSLVKIWSFFKNWLQLVSVTVSSKRKKI